MDISPLNFLPSFQNLPIRLGENGHILLYILVFILICFFVFFVVVGGVLVYHWRRYGMGSRFMLLVEGIFLVIGLFLFVGAGIILKQYSYGL